MHLNTNLLIRISYIIKFLGIKDEEGYDDGGNDNGDDNDDEDNNYVKNQSQYIQERFDFREFEEVNK